MRPRSTACVPLLLALLAADCRPSTSQEAEQDAGDAHAEFVRVPLPSPEEIAKLPPDGGDEFNRLVFSQSPYLLQHARNPVDWYPWGAEAFEVARREDKPVFLSVGYSTCHWCHVMEHESFEDPEVAALMNSAFVCIKVDREERPDLDHVFMSVTQAMTGSGGWPMTVIMTPDQEPFFAGTYFPKTSRFGRPGMMELVPQIAAAWRNDRKNVLASASDVSNWMQNLGKGNPGGELEPEVLDLAYRRFANRFDEVHAGFGTDPPKFPMPHNLLFLLQYSQRNEGTRALEMAHKTLRAMRLGGMYDQVGFGFHRYSTDQRWFLPHFEKMLYDQAILVMAYTAGWQLTGDPLLERTAREILTYVLRDMTAPSGGFYSAEDADSEGEEGLFYLWRESELDEVLGAEDAALVKRVFGTTAEGNFVEEATRERTGRNLFFLRKPPEELATELELEPTELDRRLEAARAKLFAERQGRIHPLKDDKILTDWNGLMIAGLSRAAQAFDDAEYEAAARRAADFALAELKDEDGRLYKRSRLGVAGLPGTLEDYAFLVWGLIELYETCFDVHYLTEAIALTDTMVAHFRDEENGGFFLSADDAAELLGVRGKEAYDGAIPSGNSVAAWNLLRLARITGRTDLEQLAAGALRSHSKTVAQSPSAHTQLLRAVDFAQGPSYEIVIAGDPEAEDTAAMLRAFRSRYLPNKVLLLRPPGDSPITKIAPFTEAQSSSGPATAYVCRDFACKAPTRDVDVALGFLEEAAWE